MYVVLEMAYLGDNATHKSKRTFIEMNREAIFYYTNRVLIYTKYMYLSVFILHIFIFLYGE